MFRHSSRKRPLKDSMWAFCTGLPGWMKAATQLAADQEHRFDLAEGLFPPDDGRKSVRGRRQPLQRSEIVRDSDDLAAPRDLLFG